MLKMFLNVKKFCKKCLTMFPKVWKRLKCLEMVKDV